jgi:trehalose-6-phosphatase
VDWDKGRAVEWMLECLDMNHPSVLPIYISDDVTDEAAFQALRGTGVCICVRGENDTRMTWADYTVKTLPKSVLFYQC